MTDLLGGPMTMSYEPTSLFDLPALDGVSLAGAALLEVECPWRAFDVRPLPIQPQMWEGDDDEEDEDEDEEDDEDFLGDDDLEFDEDDEAADDEEEGDEAGEEEEFDFDDDEDEDEDEEDVEP